MDCIKKDTIHFLCKFLLYAIDDIILNIQTISYLFSAFMF